ncbi:hypothetical protein DOTSEDRAFT_30023 [Dothistroma septosporum NZE10]|uniref:Uncharacterized protein n=1 Tax=Dothistroma septosporum (strain NZE10 / CBS 128990) TaxID=675120 RepID=N1Q038_DOTSN|nr:hypothetical protein DOTSEDRAFT_30023 [Dothistroma septosporum NZE10]
MYYERDCTTGCRIQKGAEQCWDECKRMSRPTQRQGKHEIQDYSRIGINRFDGNEGLATAFRTKVLLKSVFKLRESYRRLGAVHLRECSRAESVPTHRAFSRAVSGQLSAAVDSGAPGYNDIGLIHHWPPLHGGNTSSISRRRCCTE